MRDTSQIIISNLLDLSEFPLDLLFSVTKVHLQLSYVLRSKLLSHGYLWVPSTNNQIFRAPVQRYLYNFISTVSGHQFISQRYWITIFEAELHHAIGNVVSRSINLLQYGDAHLRNAHAEFLIELAKKSELLAVLPRIATDVHLKAQLHPVIGKAIPQFITLLQDTGEDCSIRDAGEKIISKFAEYCAFLAILFSLLYILLISIQSWNVRWNWECHPTVHQVASA